MKTCIVLLLPFEENSPMLVLVVSIDLNCAQISRFFTMELNGSFLDDVVQA